MTASPEYHRNNTVKTPSKHHLMIASRLLTSNFSFSSSTQVGMDLHAWLSIVDENKYVLDVLFTRMYMYMYIHILSF